MSAPVPSWESGTRGRPGLRGRLQHPRHSTPWAPSPELGASLPHVPSSLASGGAGVSWGNPGDRTLGSECLASADCTPAPSPGLGPLHCDSHSHQHQVLSPGGPPGEPCKEGVVLGTPDMEPDRRRLVITRVPPPHSLTSADTPPSTGRKLSCKQPRSDVRPPPRPLDLTALDPEQELGLQPGSRLPGGARSRQLLILGPRCCHRLIRFSRFDNRTGLI